MTDSLFARFYDLVKRNNKDILSVFAVNENSHTSGRGDNLEYIHQNGYTRDYIISNAPNLIEEMLDSSKRDAAIKRISQLPPDKKNRLWEILLNKSLTSAIKDNDITAEFFADVPNYKIEIRVSDKLKSRDNRIGRKKEHGKYDIYLVSSDGSYSQIIDFSKGKYSKLFYMYFLLYPRTEIKRDENLKDSLKELFNQVYDFSDDNSRKYDSDSRFYKDLTIPDFKFLISDANKAVTDALPESENKDWYIINTERNEKKKNVIDSYALSLFSECIIIPKELQDSLKSKEQKELEDLKKILYE